MALTHLLDTNVLSRLMREPRGTTATRLQQVGDEHLCTSIVVASELRYGAARRGGTRLPALVEEILDALPVLAFEAPADREYADLRAHLERAGTPIGPNDLLIAAQARALDLVLVTENLAEFERVPRLTVESWELAPPSP
jgi:tRNA(fMet)-specific endonuclease VapC